MLRREDENDYSEIIYSDGGISVRIPRPNPITVEYSLFDPEIDAKIPTRASEHAAGFDLYSAHNHGHLFTEEVMFVRTNLVMAIPPGWVGKIYPRSGLATKYGIRLANCTGIIDSDYRGEVLVALYRDKQFRKMMPDPPVIEKYTRVAQIVFEPVQDVNFVLKSRDELSDTKRGEGGFGSTGQT